MRASTFGTILPPVATAANAAAAPDAASGEPAESPERSQPTLLARLTSQPGASRAFVMAAALSAATWGVIAVLDWLLHHQHRQVAFSSFTDLLGATAAAVAIIIGVVGVVLFLLGGDRGTLWAAWAVLLLGALTLGFARASPLATSGPRSSVLAFVGPATIPVVLWMMARPLWPAPLPAAVGRARSVLRAAAAIGALTALLELSPHAARVLGGTTGAASNLGEILGQVAMAVVWLSLAAAYCAQGTPGGRQMPNLAFAVLGLGLAESRVALILSHSRQDIWLTGNEMLRLVGLFVALMVVVAKLQERLTEDRSALLDSLIGIGVAERQRRARRIMQDALTHDVRSALFALDGAAQTLASHYERLSDKDRTDLTGMLAAGVDHLKGVVDRQLEAVQTFDLAQILSPLLREERRAMRPVRSEIGAGVTVAGRPADTVAVLQAVLSLARRGTPEVRSVRVAAAQLGPWVEVTVAPESEDRPEGLRVLPQYRPVEPATPSEASFEMYVCARLMQEQGGELLHASVSGQNAYAVRLPIEEPTDVS